ncbi:MAG: gamma-glutamylcyclotransferase [Actinomycetota bacterium]|nr:gamma-glutamylcyclotransferase [Actinomycetota bacterium]
MPDLLEPPPRLDLPLFDYGLLKPGEPAHDLLADIVVHTEAATLPNGGLRVRDGLPLLDPDGTLGVQGVLLTFTAGKEKRAYTAVCEVAPRQHYRWDMTEMRVEGRPGRVNVLRGRHPDRGSSDEWFSSWSGAADPLLRFGLTEVRRAAFEHATAPFPTVGGEDAAMWERFYGLQAAYLLLWAAVERFTALAYGPAQAALERTWRLGDDPRFRQCVVAAGVAPSAKTADSRDPTRARRIREDGSGAMFSWDAARHLVAHPGRTAFADGVFLRRSLVDLHDTFRLALLDRMPALAEAWRRTDPHGEDDRWLLRPLVESAD